MSASAPLRAIEPHRLPPAAGREQQSLVSPQKLSDYIQILERACAEDPTSADLRTCLGMAHAINADIDRSLEELRVARRLDPQHFFAQFKFAETLGQKQSFCEAEKETRTALELARTPWEVSMAKRHLDEMRRKQMWRLSSSFRPTLAFAALFAGAAVLLLRR